MKKILSEIEQNCLAKFLVDRNEPSTFWYWVNLANLNANLAFGKKWNFKCAHSKETRIFKVVKIFCKFFGSNKNRYCFFLFFPKNAAKILGWKMAKFCQARQRHHRCNSFFFASVPIKMVEKEGKTLRWECSEKGKMPNKTKLDVKEITSWLLPLEGTQVSSRWLQPYGCVNMQFFPEWKNYPAIADSSD